MAGRPQPQPQQAPGQEFFRAPFQLVENTGSTALATGNRLVQSVPSGINTVTDFTLGTINGLPDTLDTTVNAAVRVPVTAFRVVNGGVSGAVNTAGQAFNPARFVHFGNSAIDTIQAVPATAIRTTSGALASGASGASELASGLLPDGSTEVLGDNDGVRGTQTFFESGMTGLQNVATDGLSMIAQAPQNVLDMGGSVLKSGGAFVTGGTRLVLAGGDSLVNTGINTVTGGGRVLFSTAQVPFRMASQAFERLRQLF